MRKVGMAMVLTALSAPGWAAQPVSGKWYTENKDSVIEIAPCGAQMCGRVIQVLRPTPDGKPAIDRNNPDPKLRNRPILGITLLSGFVDAGGHWAGRIYDPRAGRTYSSTLERLANGLLKVKGCLGPFCRSVHFSPAR